jgi:hypothetical protein
MGTTTLDVPAALALTAVGHSEQAGAPVRSRAADKYLTVITEARGWPGVGSCIPWLAA